MSHADPLEDDPDRFAHALDACRDHDRIRRDLGDAAHRLIGAQRFAEALRIFDAIVPFGDLPLPHYCNALWVVQRDNTGLPVDPARSLRYLAACLPFAEANPSVHLNAAGVLAELADSDAALDHLLLAARGGVDLAPFLQEPLFAPLRASPRWEGLTRGATVEAPGPLDLALACFRRGAVADAVPALLVAWHRTRAPRIADLIDRVCDAVGSRPGYGAGWIDRALRDGAAALPELVRVHSSVSVIRDGRGGYATDRDVGGLALLRCCDDPRYATAVLAFLADPPPLRQRKKVEDGLAIALAQLVALGDVRGIDGLDDLARHGPLGPWLRGEVDRTATALLGQRVPALDPEDEDTCSRLAEVLDALYGTVPATPARSPAPAPTPDGVAGPPEPLAAAAEALRAGRRDEAVALLLPEWRRTRSPDLAELIELVGGRAGSAPEPQEAWVAHAQQGRPEDLPLLLRSLVTGDAAESAERIWALRDRADPRLTTALLGLLDEPRFVLAREAENGVEEYWDALMDGLLALDDPRAVEPVRRSWKRIRSVTVGVDRGALADMYTQSPLGPYLERRLGELAGELRARGTELTGAETASVGVLRELLSSEAAAAEAAREERRLEEQVRDGFLDAIALDPADPAKRAAYGRWLLERGEEETRCLGELAAILRVERWEGGFPTVASIDLAGTEPWRFVGHRGWATIHWIRTDSMDWYSHEDGLLAVIGDGVMRSLRAVEGLPESALLALTDDREQPWTMLGIDPPSDWTRILAALDRLPELRVLHLSASYLDWTPGQLAPLLASPVAERLERLVLTVNRGRVGTGVEAWLLAVPEADRSALRRLELQWGTSYGGGSLPGAVRACAATSLAFTRDPDGRLSELRVAHVPGEEPPIGELLSLLLALDPPALTSFTLAPGDVAPPARLVAELERALRRFPGLRRVELPPADDPVARTEALLEQLAAGDADAARELARLQVPEARAPLAEILLRGPDEHLAIAVVSALAELADRSSVPALRTALARPERHSSLLAASVLGELGAAEAAGDLVALLAATPIHGGPPQVLHALGMLGERSVIPAILARLEAELDRPREEGPNATLRAALDALGWLRAVEARPLALRALLSGHDYDRGAAAAALGLVGEPVDRVAFASLAADRRALLAGLLLAPGELDAARMDALRAGLERWAAGDSEPLITVARSLEVLASRVVASRSVRELAVRVRRFCVEATEPRRARLVAGGSSAWNLPALKVVARELDRVAAAWAPL